MGKVKVYRTAEGTLFEIVSAVLCAVALPLTLMVDNAALLVNNVITWLIMVGVTALLLGLAYHPDSEFINLPVKRNPDNLPQMALVTRLLRVLALQCAALGIVIPLGLLKGCSSVSRLLSMLFVAVMLLTSAVAVYKIRKADRH